ncbi:Pvc16 family protein [Actinokineospora bangkokensis]|uniref:Pvc16 N-terminal domain-containing protein n=1 Tax=Actinokineospora bangkokensis TaxID=1193682 RepID=A0A1Q9LLI1_9PSEU|nr:Pvc16 family protein [Actinokineospora bangkokensis]OLR92875.1 hypothetical protein BJP25_19310 [Actinokineospora bangkokensis]
MLHHIDSAFADLLRVVAGPGVDVRFAPPTGRAGAAAPVLSALLHTVSEDTDNRLGGWVEERDDHGRVVGRRAPVRRFQVGYLLAAWCADPVAEHELLGAVLTGLCARPAIGVDDLPEGLRLAGAPVHVDIANPSLPRAPVELRTRVGGPARAALDVVLTATWLPGVDTDLDPAPEEIGLGVGREVPRPPPRGPALPPPRARIQE